MVRYIHLNPLRAGIIENIDKLNYYHASGHVALMGNIERAWRDVAYVLRYFGEKQGAARKAYLEYIRIGVSQGQRSDLTGGGLVRSAGGWKMLKERRRANLHMKGDERILGSGDFVKAILKKANEDFEQRTLLKIKGPNLETLIRRVCQYLDVEPEDIKNNSKYQLVSRARAIVCYLATCKLMIPNVAVAKSLNISPSTVCKAALRGKKDKATESIQKKVLGNIGFD